MGLAALGSFAPWFARNRRYVEENVGDPSDYVVLDHDDVEKTILRAGISPTDFWNVWRLTPGLFYDGEVGEWVVKYEFDKLEGAAVRSVRLLTDCGEHAGPPEATQSRESCRYTYEANRISRARVYGLPQGK